jgi:uncharacterized protein (TIGR02145 family)
MKKLLLALLLLVVTMSVYSAEPAVKFYLSDGTFKTYNLSDIDNLQFPNASDTLQLQVFTKDSTYYYPAQLIDSVKFFVDEKNEDRIHLWHDGFKWDFGVHEIDSILIYYTKHVAVTIGTQHWMYRNLDVDHYRNGDSIPEVRDSAQWLNLKTGAWCYYNNDPANGAIFGKLYNWYPVNDPRGLAPEGWHVSSDVEWTSLTEYLGGDTLAGGKLKEAGTTHWYSPNTGATNYSGFSALPGGYRYYYGTFYDVGDYGHCWSSTYYGTTYEWARLLYYYDASIYRIIGRKESGHSVRCIKDK